MSSSPLREPDQLWLIVMNLDQESSLDCCGAVRVRWHGLPASHIKDKLRRQDIAAISRDDSVSVCRRIRLFVKATFLFIFEGRCSRRHNSVAASVMGQSGELTLCSGLEGPRLRWKNFVIVLIHTVEDAAVAELASSRGASSKGGSTRQVIEGEREAVI